MLGKGIGDCGCSANSRGLLLLPLAPMLGRGDVGEDLGPLRRSPRLLLLAGEEGRPFPLPLLCAGALGKRGELLPLSLTAPRSPVRRPPALSPRAPLGAPLAPFARRRRNLPSPRLSLSASSFAVMTDAAKEVKVVQDLSFARTVAITACNKRFCPIAATNTARCSAQAGQCSNVCWAMSQLYALFLLT